MSASPVDALGYVAAVLTTSSFFPQALKTLRTGDTSGISLGMYLMFTSGVVVWAIFGMVTGDGPVLISNLITALPAGLILQRKIVNISR
ncbi:SemiSWEET transporter [Cyanobium sp. L1E-Cus]|uniref:SemiSWEET transporter n=1 Tax=Cyanobium sp. L1E-Cus TaxID=2823714 RepID=UPI0020CF53F1|nr:SemiSWEET transporter [Cyanobium sp. L1E-Cus]MCP9823649.1 SemiSWEET transporter [Cyanobium sp. L1E-Cus]